MEKLNVYDPAKNKPVLAGNLDGDTFIKLVTNKHFMVKLRAYGISSIIITELNKRNVKRILIKAKKHHYYSELSDWSIHAFIRDYGHGRQHFLPVSLMTEVTNG